MEKCPKCGSDLIPGPIAGTVVCENQYKRETPDSDEPLCDYVGADEGEE